MLVTSRSLSISQAFWLPYFLSHSSSSLGCFSFSSKPLMKFQIVQKASPHQSGSACWLSLGSLVTFILHTNTYTLIHVHLYLLKSESRNVNNPSWSLRPAVMYATEVIFHIRPKWSSEDLHLLIIFYLVSHGAESEARSSPHLVYQIHFPFLSIWDIFCRIHALDCSVQTVSVLQEVKASFEEFRFENCWDLQS